MKTFNQYIVEKIKLSGDRFKKQLEAIDDPETEISTNAIKNTEVVNVKNIGEFKIDLTISSCTIEDPHFNRYNMLNDEDRERYYDENSRHHEDTVYRVVFYVIITNPNQQIYSLEAELVYIEGSLEIESWNTPVVDKFRTKENTDEFNIEDFFPDNVMNKIEYEIEQIWDFWPWQYNVSDITLKISKRYNL